jgi:two-component system, NarL family, nitrate/nitrite response regulator NarL
METNDSHATDDGNTLLVIDDHPLFRKGVAQLLALDPQLRLVGDTSTGAEGVELAKRLAPDLILLDLNMKEMNGIDTLRALRAAGVESRVVMLTVSDNPEDIVAAIRSGADGYLLKDMEPEELLVRIRDALFGRMVMSERLTGLLAQAIRDENLSANRHASQLTPRERDILACMASGLPNKLIGRQLDITEGTVKVHVKNLLKKLNFRSRVEAAVWAVEVGIKD